MTPEIDLSGLRDLHIPNAPAMWPLATGWWVLLAACLLLIIVSIVAYSIWHQRPENYALRKAQKMANSISDDLVYLKNISQLLKRVSIAVYGRTKIAPLSDKTWQDFLLKEAPDTLTKNEAHLISFAPYEQKLKTSLNRSQIAEHVELWIKKVFKNKKSS
ncbi:MAG: DUF4381 domain-containing protein [Alphaproteobacteria bacterium]|nr:DUF4381 domain-containing protein [Alphaproteobacteria bacterium]